VKATQVSLRPWCLIDRLGSIYMAGNSLGGIAESDNWARCSYMVLRIIWTFHCHERFSVGVYILTNIMNRHSISGNNTEQMLQLQMTDLQSNIVPVLMQKSLAITNS